MSTEKNGTMKYKDEDGTVYSLLPKTTMENVDGLEAALAGKAAGSHIHTKNQISDFPTSMPASDVSAWAKASTKPTYTASEVGADASGAAAQALTDAKTYTDTAVTDKADSTDLVTTYFTGSSSDGATYTATVAGVTLTAGHSFIMVPNYTSTTTTPTLNVNSLGAKNLRIRGGDYTGLTAVPANANWLASGKPVRVTYDGLFWVADLYASAEPEVTYGTDDLTAGTSTLATGKLYVVYE